MLPSGFGLRDQTNLFIRIGCRQDADELDGGSSDAVVVILQRGAEVPIHRNVQLLSAPIHLQQGFERGTPDPGVGAEGVAADERDDVVSHAAVGAREGRQAAAEQLQRVHFHLVEYSDKNC